MRLCTTTLERAFPELSGLGEGECQRLIRRARAFGGSRPALCVAVGAGAGLSWLVAFVSLAPFIADLIGPAPEWFVRLLGVVLGPYLGAAIGAASGLLWRDRVLRRALLNPVLKCLRCGYALLGLEPERDAVLCPECGREHDCDACGLGPDDLAVGLRAA